MAHSFDGSSDNSQSVDAAASQVLFDAQPGEFPNCLSEIDPNCGVLQSDQFAARVDQLLGVDRDGMQVSVRSPQERETLVKAGFDVISDMYSTYKDDPRKLAAVDAAADYLLLSIAQNPNLDMNRVSVYEAALTHSNPLIRAKAAMHLDLVKGLGKERIHMAARAAGFELAQPIDGLRVANPLKILIAALGRGEGSNAATRALVSTIEDLTLNSRPLTAVEAGKVNDRLRGSMGPIGNILARAKKPGLGVEIVRARREALSPR